MMQLEILTPPPAATSIEGVAVEPTAPVPEADHPKCGRLTKIWMKIRFYLPAASLLLLVVVFVLITVRYFLHEHEEEFVITPPLVKVEQTTTVVTAHLTLESPSSPHFHQQLEKAHSEMILVLRLRQPMVIFTDGHSLEFVVETRRMMGMENETKVWNITMEDVPLHSQMVIFQDVLKQERFSPAELSHPFPFIEMDAPALLLSHAKAHFLSNASIANPFHTPSFSWINSDYGKGNATYFPSTSEWNPDLPSGKISLLKLAPANDSLSLYTKEKLHRTNATLVSSDFLAGDSPTIERFHKAYEARLVDVTINDRMVADPQMILVLMINEVPELFNVVQSEWFSAFHLF